MLIGFGKLEINYQTVILIQDETWNLNTNEQRYFTKQSARVTSNRLEWWVACQSKNLKEESKIKFYERLHRGGKVDL